MNVCLRVLCAFVLVLALFFQGTGEARAASSTSPAPLTVALFLEDVHDAYALVLTAGLEQAKQRYGITYDIILSPDASKHEEDFVRVSKTGYDLVLVPTIAFHTLLINNAGNFPKTRFAAINTRIKAPNVVSYTFADAEGAFLAGAAAALLTAQPESGATPAGGEQKIGWVGGPDIPQSQGFLAGYRQGAKYIAPDLRVISVFTESFDDATGGRTAAAKLYSEGARYIMHAGGRTGLGVIQAATQHQRHAIGLIANQDNIASSVVLSLEKHVDKAVLAAVQSIHEGTYKGGELVHLNLANGGFSLSQSPQLSPVISARLDHVSRDIQQKKITVDSGAGKGLCDCL